MQRTPEIKSENLFFIPLIFSLFSFLAGYSCKHYLRLASPTHQLSLKYGQKCPPPYTPLSIFELTEFEFLLKLFHKVGPNSTCKYGTSTHLAAQNSTATVRVTCQSRLAFTTWNAPPGGQWAQ